MCQRDFLWIFSYYATVSPSGLLGALFACSGFKFPTLTCQYSGSGIEARADLAEQILVIQERKRWRFQ